MIIKSLIIKIISSIGIILLVFSLGLKIGKNKQRNKKLKRTIRNVKKAKNIENNINKLNRSDKLDRL